MDLVQSQINIDLSHLWMHIVNADSTWSFLINRLDTFPYLPGTFWISRQDSLFLSF